VMRFLSAPRMAHDIGSATKVALNRVTGLPRYKVRGIDA